MPDARDGGRAYLVHGLGCGDGWEVLLGRRVLVDGLLVLRLNGDNE